jgi:molybdopterin-guanine dinucleotide biosynthesis protein B
MSEEIDPARTESDPRVVCVAGPSDAGKTALVETLVPKLSDGTRVATVKSIHHDIEPDTPGTDTYRHRTAGADTVVGVTPSLTFEVTPGGKETNPDAASPPGTAGDREALERVVRRLAARGYDVVLVEGFSSVPLPTIAVGDPPEEGIEGEIIATDRTDPDAIVEAIEKLEPGGPFVRDG